MVYAILGSLLLLKLVILLLLSSPSLLGAAWQVAPVVGKDTRRSVIARQM